MTGDSTADEQSYTLEELVERLRRDLGRDKAPVHARTVRSWVQAGLLPKPAQRGPVGGYNREHLDRLKFIVACHEAVDRKRLPREALRRGMRGLSPQQMRQVLENTDVETMARVARGEEQVLAVGEALPVRERVVGELREPLACYEPQLTLPKPAGAERTTTFHVLEDLDLHLRSDDPERVAWAARLARKIAEWVEKER